MPTKCFYLLLVLLLQLSPQYSSIKFSDNGSDLIHSTCEDTSNYNLCVASLELNPWSATADVKGLAVIALGVLRTNASSTLDIVEDLLKKTTSRILYGMYETCVEEYKTIVGTRIPGAENALALGTYDVASKSADDAAADVKVCQDQFPGGCPFAGENRVARDLSLVCSDIIKLLH